MLVAAADRHTLLLENVRIRILEKLIPSVDTTPVHTHRYPSVYYVISRSHFLRTNDQRRVMMDSREVESLAEPPTVLWAEALPPHALQNVGDAELRLVSVELKETHT